MKSWRVKFGGALMGLVASLAFSACGSRTEIPGPQTCEAEGLTRACSDACGLGEQRCADGVWQPCEVASTQRTCQNDCGSGTQRCEAGEWQSCEVPIQTRTCTNDCGTGAEECRDGEWQGCEVPVQTRSCENECGAGTEECRDGEWTTCVVQDVQRGCATVCGTGFETCRGGRWGRCDAPLPKPPKLKAVVRDFLASHPDFEEDVSGLDVGIVEPDLGADGKPVYGPHSSTLTTTSKASFDQWYRDVPGVNVSEPIELQLRPSPEDPSLFVYDDYNFFPIDGKLFGNEGRNHNYHFTLEASTFFDYVGGETFTFSGDDDMWVFINGRLAIDLGGLHQSLTRRVELDQASHELRIEKGNRYTLSFFFAERHTFQSNFSIRTSIAEAGSCD